ncbi:MAG: hypothetical protein R3B49_07780 [Phycisphaerales bacterium]
MICERTSSLGALIERASPSRFHPGCWTTSTSLQAVDASDGGDGDFAHRHHGAEVVGEAGDRFENLVEVVERLAHAHEDDVVEVEGLVGFEQVAGGGPQAIQPMRWRRMTVCMRLAEELAGHSARSGSRDAWCGSWRAGR